MSNQSKVTLLDFDGNPKKTYSVSMEKVTPNPSEIKKKLGHQIIVVDRSGSMWHDIEALKDTVIKVLTLNEFEDSDMIVSLISYSSKGDVTLHFERVPVSEVMKAGSEHLQEIKRIRATFLTCISQAMVVASGLVNDDEITGIMLHSDGYANDPSPRYESSELDSICEGLSTKDVFVNTIAYSNYSDFVLLSRVADSVSGKCVKATTTKEVYDAITESCKMISEGQSAVAEIEAKGADYSIFMSKDPQKIIGRTGDFTVKGVGDSNYLVFRFAEQELDPDAVLNGPVSDPLARTALYGMAYAKLAAGQINEAKMAMLSSLNATLIDNNIRALTPNQLASMSEDIMTAVFSSNASKFYTSFDSIASGPSILDLVSVLDENRHDILINVEKVRSGYNRRGLKKKAGKRESDGSVTIPPVDTEIADNSEFVKMGSFEINRDAATVNMQIERRCNLVERESRKVIPEVAGILLNDLKDYKKYTVVGDGEVNLPSMFVRFSTKKAFEEVQSIGLLKGEKYSHSTEYELELSKMPVCSLSSSASIDPSTFTNLCTLNILGRILTALSSGKSSDYSAEQVDELRKYCLSDSLYVNIPMMTAYDDLDEAIKEGIVDSRNTYKVTVGNSEILNVGKFKSANAFLDRMYVADKMNDNGTEVVSTIDKPKMGETFFDKSVRYGHKQLSARTKVTADDIAQRAVYDEVLGIENRGLLGFVGTLIGYDDLPKIADRKLDTDELVKIVEGAKRAIARAERNMWATLVSPVVFHIGSTGILPDSMNTVAMSAEEISAKYPELKLSKDEKEGTFFDVNGVILSVYAEKAYFSVDRKAEDSQEESQVAVATA